MLELAQTSKPFTPWEDCPQNKVSDAHSANVETYRMKDSFDKDLSEYALKNNGSIEYDSIAYKRQREYITSHFYRKISNGRKTIWGIYDSGEPDEEIDLDSLKGVVRKHFNLRVQPLLLNEDNLLYYIRTISGEAYNPTTNKPFFDHENRNKRNLFKPYPMSRTEEVFDIPTVFQEYLDRLMPRDQVCTTSDGTQMMQQTFLCNFMAQRLQCPSEPPSMLILLRGEHGTGKSFFLEEILRPAMGVNYLSSKMKNVNTRFNNDIYNKTLVQLEEVEEGKESTHQELKRLITQKEATVEKKGVEGVTRKKYFSFVGTSNHTNPIRIEQNDRRIFVACFSRHKESKQESKEWFRQTFAPWIEKQENLQEVVNYLLTLDIRNIDWRDPPMTEDKAALEETVNPAEETKELLTIQLREVYRRSLFKVTSVKNEWKTTQTSARQALEDAGFIKLRKKWFSSSKEHTEMYIHESLIPNDKDWDADALNWELFTKRDYGSEDRIRDYYDV